MAKGQRPVVTIFLGDNLIYINLFDAKFLCLVAVYFVLGSNTSPTTNVFGNSTLPHSVSSTNIVINDPQWCQLMDFAASEAVVPYVKQDSWAAYAVVEIHFRADERKGICSLKI